MSSPGGLLLVFVGLCCDVWALFPTAWGVALAAHTARLLHHLTPSNQLLSPAAWCRVASHSSSMLSPVFSVGLPPIRSTTAPTNMSETLRGYAASASPVHRTSRALRSEFGLAASAEASRMTDGHCSAGGACSTPSIFHSSVNHPEQQLSAPNSADQLSGDQPSLGTAFGAEGEEGWDGGAFAGPPNDGQQSTPQQQQQQQQEEGGRPSGRLRSILTRVSANWRARSRSAPGLAPEGRVASHVSSVLSTPSTGPAPINSVASLQAFVGHIGDRQPSWSHQSPPRLSSPAGPTPRWRKRSGLLAGPAAAASLESEEAAIERVVLSLKVLLAAGTVCLFHVGGGQSASASDPAGVPQWEFFIGDAPHAGSTAEAADGVGDSGGHPPQRQPMAQLAAIDGLANRGQTVLSAEAAALVQGACILQELEGGAMGLVRLLARDQLRDQLPPTLQRLWQGDQPAPQEKAARETAQEVAQLTALPEAQQAAALQVLRMHLLENVRVRIEAGHIDYVNEARWVWRL